MSELFKMLGDDWSTMASMIFDESISYFRKESSLANLLSSKIKRAWSISTLKRTLGSIFWIVFSFYFIDPIVSDGSEPKTTF